MTIGEKIRELRRREDITQEQLAEYLSISTQAVSKWENNITLPDITMIVPLANFFHVTPDTLFDFDSEREAKDIDTYQAKSLELLNKGRTAEAIELWREAVSKYPQNFNCCYQLSSVLYFTAINICDKSKRENMLHEVASICERILRDCTDDDIRSSARQILVFSYSALHDEENAVKNAMQTTTIHVSREMLLPNVYDDPEKRRESTQRLIYILFDQFIINAAYMDYRSTEDKIKALETITEIAKLFIPDGNYLFLHVHIENIHLLLAHAYAEKLDRENTIKQLKLAIFHAKAYDNQPDGDINYTSVFIDSCTNNKSKNTKNYDSSDAELIRRELGYKCYDFIRDDSEFQSLFNK
ncbi:MAG: helix-turn-helix transcriptional regulator [Clostridiales bacterium]|nr:helix-turn-helix transcriptional regulator [Clostridiales bacterium]